MFTDKSRKNYFLGIFKRFNKKNLRIHQKSPEAICKIINQRYPEDEGLLKVYKINGSSSQKQLVKEFRICQSLEPLRN
ncbi:MAG: hypothetical protein ACOC4M_15520 [Promethearchaeia archaeon]